MPENYFEGYRRAHGAERTYTRLMSEVDKVFDVIDKYSSSNPPDGAQAQRDLEYLQTHSNITLTDISDALAAFERERRGGKLLTLIKTRFDVSLIPFLAAGVDEL